VELKDEIRSQFRRCHRLAKKSYDKGDTARAVVEYLNCAQLLEHLSRVSAPQRRSDLLTRSQKFRDIAVGVWEGTVTVYTSGVKALEVAPARQD